jgi:hypothetical protein
MLNLVLCTLGCTFNNPTLWGMLNRGRCLAWCIEALCFGDFHLGQQMKVTRLPGRIPGAV